ncbi:MAG: hypothetical protein ACJAYU_004859 [Bradymonadia bacterium]|jgi:hypothetical protein
MCRMPFVLILDPLPDSDTPDISAVSDADSDADVSLHMHSEPANPPRIEVESDR